MWCLINLHPRDPGGRENVYTHTLGDSAPSPAIIIIDNASSIPLRYTASRAYVYYIYMYNTLGCDVVRATT